MRRQAGFDQFVQALQAKCERGEREYGDDSFDRPLLDILNELQAEALDLAGWGWVLWTRIEKLKGRATHAEQECATCGRPHP